MLEACFHCGKAFKSFHGVGQHVKAMHREIVAASQLFVTSLAAKRNRERGSQMGKSIADVKSERGIGGPPMLRGQDIPRAVNQVKIKVKEMREAPNSFKSPYILDLAEPVHDREAFAVNITNLRALAELSGQDAETADVDKVCKWVAGKTLTLYAVMTNNPQTKKMVRSLFFSADGSATK
jgi:hypothetical protein